MGASVFPGIQIEKDCIKSETKQPPETALPPFLHEVALNPIFHPDCTFRKSLVQMCWLKLCLLVLHSFLIGIPILLLYGKLYPDLNSASSLAFSSPFFHPAPNLIIYFYSNLQWLLLASDLSLNSLTWPNYCHPCLCHISHLLPSQVQTVVKTTLPPM